MDRSTPTIKINRIVLPQVVKLSISKEFRQAIQLPTLKLNKTI